MGITIFQRKMNKRGKKQSKLKKSRIFVVSLIIFLKMRFRVVLVFVSKKGLKMRVYF